MIAETINSIKDNVTNAYNALQTKGATIPQNKNIENLASTINTVSGGKEAVLIEKEAKENGIFVAKDEGADGYSKFTVNVASSGGDNDQLPKYLNDELTTLDLTNAKQIKPYTFYSSFGIKKVICPNYLTGTSLYSTDNSTATYARRADYAFAKCKWLNDGEIKLGSGDKSNPRTLSSVFRNVGQAQNSTNLVIKILIDYSMSCDYAFYYAKAKKVIFEGSGTIDASSSNYMFHYSTIDELIFEKLTQLPAPQSIPPFNYAKINKLFAKKITQISYNTFNTSNSGYINKLVLGSNCSLGAAGSGYISTNAQIFVPYSAIDTYSQGTNWTTLFTNSGEEETRMAVYGDFATGDTLPTQIGTIQVYNVTWYEDIDFTTQASGTATETKEYYGKISAVV